MYVRFSCFVVRGCAVLRRYINVFNCDMFSDVNVYLNHLKFCVVCSMVEGMSVVVNLMLFLRSVTSQPPALCNLSARAVVKLCNFVCVCFRGELGFLNCDDICMYFVKKPLQLLEFFIVFMLTCSIMRFISLLLLCL